MPLINLQTSLRDLKYGNDRPNGNSSNQPYLAKSFVTIGNNGPDVPIPQIYEGGTIDLGTVGGGPIDVGVIDTGNFQLSAASGFLTAQALGLTGVVIGAAVGGVGGAAVGGAIGLGVGAGVAAFGLNNSTNTQIGGTFNTPAVGGTFQIPQIGGGNISLGNAPDFLIRGGLSNPAYGVQDIYRLGSYFSDFNSPSGLYFTLKQNILSRLAVRTETSGLLNESAYTPISTLAQAGVVGLGVHLNKQGLNPIPNSIFSLDTYRQEIQYDQYEEIQNRNATYRSLSRNRLVALFRVKILDDLDSKRLNGIIIDSDDTEHLLSYRGGPGSLLGIGKTKFKISCTTPLWARYNRDLDFFDGKNGQTDRGDIIFDEDDEDESQIIKQEEADIEQEAGDNSNNNNNKIPCPDPPVTVYTVAPGPASSAGAGAAGPPTSTSAPPPSSGTGYPGGLPSAAGTGPVSSYGGGATPGPSAEDRLIGPNTTEGGQDAAERAAKPSAVSQLINTGGAGSRESLDTGRASSDIAPSNNPPSAADDTGKAPSDTAPSDFVGLPYTKNTLSAINVEDPPLPDFTPMMIASNTSQNRPYDGYSLSGVAVTDNQTGETRPLSEMMMDPNGPGLSGIMAQSGPGQRYSFGFEEVTIIGNLSKPKGPEYATPEIVSQMQNPSPVPEPSSGPSGNTPPPNPTPTEGVPPLLQRPDEQDKPCPDAPILRGTDGSERKRKRHERKEARKKLRQERRERRRLKRKARRRVKKLIRSPKPMF